MVAIVKMSPVANFNFQSFYEWVECKIAECAALARKMGDNSLQISCLTAKPERRKIRDMNAESVRRTRIFSSKTDKFEMAYMEDVPHAVRFPYRMTLAGWVIADPENYRDRHEGAGKA